MHADGAFGAAAAISPRGRTALEGLELADSLSIDPHKWLFQTFECGCVLLRDGRQLKETYQILPDYLQDLRGMGEVNPCDYGIQLSRGFRALKVWLSVQVFGMAAFRAAVEHGFELAEYAQRRLESMPDWEIVSPAQMGTLAFRYAPSPIDTRLVDAMLKDGHALVSSTVLRGVAALRMCTINPRTTHQDIDGTLERMDLLAKALSTT